MKPKAKKSNRRASASASASVVDRPPEFKRLMEIFERVQEEALHHRRYISEMVGLHSKMNHDQFVDILLFGLKKWFRTEINNEWSQMGVKFLARFCMECAKAGNLNVIESINDWLLKTTSTDAQIRAFICFFVDHQIKWAAILKVALDFDEFPEYLLNFLADINASVRASAAVALCNFQADEHVVERLIFHLNRDPVSKVRRAIIKYIKFTDETVPIILERLRDIDSEVRGQLYDELTERNVKTLTIAQRLHILNAARKESNENVQRVIARELLLCWLQSYDNKYLSLLSAIKYDATDEDIVAFVATSDYVLSNLFELIVYDADLSSLKQQIGLLNSGEYSKCLPISNITLELLVFWRSFIRFSQNKESLADEVCDLSTLCSYIQFYIDGTNEANLNEDGLIDKQYEMQILTEILLLVDVDEFGRFQLEQLAQRTLLNETHFLNETAISNIVKHTVKFMQPDQIDEYFLVIVRSIATQTSSIDEQLQKLATEVNDPEAKLRIAQLTLRILGEREQVNEILQYGNLLNIKRNIIEMQQQVIEVCRADCTEINFNLDADALIKRDIIKCLQIYNFLWHVIPTTNAPPQLSFFFHAFVREQLRNADLEVRCLALQTATAYALRYKTMARELLDASFEQLLTNQNAMVWSVAITVICELLDRHHIEYHIPGLLDDDSMSSNEEDERTSNLVDHLLQMLGNIEEECVMKALVTGLCRLILSGYMTNKHHIAKVLAQYFKPSTFSSTHQIMAVFFDTLDRLKRQGCLIPSLIPLFNFMADSHRNLSTICNNILKFFVEITKTPGSKFQWHSQLAIEIIKLLRDVPCSVDVQTVSNILKDMRIQINEEFRKQVREPLCDLLNDLTGDEHKIVKQFWKKCGFKNSDRIFTDVSSLPTTSSRVTKSVPPQTSTRGHSLQGASGAIRKRTNLQDENAGLANKTDPQLTDKRTTTSVPPKSSTRGHSPAKQGVSGATRKRTTLQDENIENAGLVNKTNSQPTEMRETRQAFGNRENC